MSRYAILLAVLAAGLLGGCASRTPAPVIERGGAPGKGPAPVTTPAKPGEFHTVKRGETLYSIALEHGQSYRDVAAWNNIDNPNVIPDRPAIACCASGRGCGGQAGCGAGSR